MKVGDILTETTELGINLDIDVDPVSSQTLTPPTDRVKLLKILVVPLDVCKESGCQTLSLTR